MTPCINNFEKWNQFLSVVEDREEETFIKLHIISLKPLNIR